MTVTENIPLKEFNDGSLTGGVYRLQKKFGFEPNQIVMAGKEQLKKG